MKIVLHCLKCKNRQWLAPGRFCKGDSFGCVNVFDGDSYMVIDTRAGVKCRLLPYAEPALVCWPPASDWGFFMPEILDQIEFRGTLENWKAAVADYLGTVADDEFIITQMLDSDGRTIFDLMSRQFLLQPDAIDVVKIVASPSPSDPNSRTRIRVLEREGDPAQVLPRWERFCAWLDAEAWIGDSPATASMPEPEPEDEQPPNRDGNVTWADFFDWYYDRLPSWARLNLYEVAKHSGYAHSTIKREHARYIPSDTESTKS